MEKCWVKCETELERLESVTRLESHFLVTRTRLESLSFFSEMTRLDLSHFSKNDSTRILSLRLESLSDYSQSRSQQTCLLFVESLLACSYHN